MTFSARDHARELIQNSGKGWRWKSVFESLPCDIDPEDVGPVVEAILAELESAQVTVTWPEPAACCKHCSHREES